MLKKSIITSLLMGLAVLAFYWAKCQLNVDLIKEINWEEHFAVLNVLQKKIPVIMPYAGEILVNTSFDDFILPDRGWGRAYDLKNGNFDEKVTLEGRKGSASLMIENHSGKPWVKEYDHWVMVTQGDRFAYLALARAEGKARASIAVMLYDKDRKVISWGYTPSTVDAGTDKAWKKLSASLEIPKETAFLRLRLYGEGQGTAFFDDIRFWRE